MKRSTNVLARLDGALLCVDVDVRGQLGRERESTTVTRFEVHKTAKWVQLSIERTYTDQPNGRTLSQRSTLHEPEARVLYEALRTVFEPAPVESPNTHLTT